MQVYPHAHTMRAEALEGALQQNYNVIRCTKINHQP